MAEIVTTSVLKGIIKKIKFAIANGSGAGSLHGVELDNYGNELILKGCKGSTFDIYFGDSNFNIISGYTKLCTIYCDSNNVEYTGLIEENIAPNDVSSLLVCEENTTNIVGATAISYAYKEENKDLGNKLYTVGLLSDVHIDATSDTNYCQEDYTNALNYFKNNTDASMVCISGDLTHQGTQADFEKWQELTTPFESTLPVYASNGNHDTYTNKYYFETYTTNQTWNKKVEKNGDIYLFICQADESSTTYLRNDTIAWLIKELEANKDKRVFLFTHYFYANIGNPNFIYSSGEPVSNDSGKISTVFRGILGNYPNVILFTGHSHTDFTEQLYNNPEANVSGANYPFGRQIHIPSCARPRRFLDGGGTLETKGNESQGALMEVYENGIKIIGLNFSGIDSTDGYENLKVPCSQYVIDTTPKITDAESNTILALVDDFRMKESGLDVGSNRSNAISTKNHLKFKSGGYVSYYFPLKVDPTKPVYIKAGKYKITNMTSGADITDVVDNYSIYIKTFDGSSEDDTLILESYENIGQEVNLGTFPSGNMYLRFAPYVASGTGYDGIDFEIRNMYIYQKDKKVLMNQRNIDLSNPNQSSGVSTASDSITFTKTGSYATWYIGKVRLNPNCPVYVKVDSVTDASGNNVDCSENGVKVAFDVGFYNDDTYTTYSSYYSEHVDIGGKGAFYVEFPLYQVSNKQLQNNIDKYMKVRVYMSGSSPATLPVTIKPNGWEVFQSYNAPMNRGLVFEIDATTGSLADISGNNVPVTTNGTCTAVEGTGVTLGNGNYLTLPTSILNGTDEFVVEIVGEVQSTLSSTAYIFGFGGTSPDRYSIRAYNVSADNQVQIRVITMNTDGTADLDLTSTSKTHLVDYNTPFHILCEKEGGNSGYCTRLVNGKRIDGFGYAGSISGDTIYIGRHYEGTNSGVFILKMIKIYSIECASKEAVAQAIGSLKKYS